MSNFRDFTFGWSFPLFRVFGIAVRMHWAFLLMVGIWLWPFNADWPMQLAECGILFGSVLLHEFGHSLACRSVGGKADRILLWPFGGLAECNPPLNPWASLWTTLCGPAVNILLMAAAALVLRAHGPDSAAVHAFAEKNQYAPDEVMALAKSFVFLNPLDTGAVAPLYGALGKWMGHVYVLNFGLFAFNMACVCYPMDAGRVVQEILWLFVGYARSLWWATNISFVFALLMMGLGIWAWVSGVTSLLAVMGYFFLRGGWARRKELAALRDHYGSWSAIPDPRADARVGGWLGRLFVKPRDAAQVAPSQEEIDRILRKVSEFGLDSLSEAELAALRSGE